ncbi:MAG: hypothetical protein RSD36_12045 [Terrisporobacter sp.]
MLKIKKQFTKNKWSKSEISFNLKEILTGVLREVLYMSILIVILLVMTKLV